jgi:threonine/homoserine/homoserine lactone efflux protein
VIFFLAGVALGLSIAAPVGPLGILCIQRTLTRGITAGFIFGLGSSLADTFYAAVAVFGASAAAGFLHENQFYLSLAGGIILLFLGGHTFRVKPAVAAPKNIGAGMFRSFISAFFLTLINPLMILPIAAIFTGLGVDTVGDCRLAAFIVGGVFVGSSAAWLGLSGIVNNLQGSFHPRHLQKVNRLAGMIIAGLGVFCLIKVFIQ